MLGWAKGGRKRYRQVIIDRLDQLILGLEGPLTHPKIGAKRDAQVRVKTLEPEYPKPHQDIPYHRLLREGP